MRVERVVSWVAVVTAFAAAAACGSEPSGGRPELSVGEPALDPQGAAASAAEVSTETRGFVGSRSTGPAPAAAASAAASTAAIDESTPNGGTLTYHGGPVMPQADIYFIWYGNWSKSTTPAILTDFVNGLSQSPYFNIANTYYNGSGVHPFDTVQFGQSYYDNYSLGKKLTGAQVDTIALNAVGPHLPFDANGIYVVATSADVTIQDPGSPGGSFCVPNTLADGGIAEPYCGWHGPQTSNGSVISVALVPDGTQCPSNCPVPSPSPNGNGGADEMATVLAHEIMESVTDPSLNAWHDSASPSNEIGDECAWNFGTEYTTSSCGSTPCANVHLGTRDFLVQEEVINQGSSVQKCAMRYYRNNDLVWRNTTTGDVVVQWGDGSPNPSFALVDSALPLQWTLVGRGDFDGDTYGDFLWRNTSTGDVYMWLMNGKTPVSTGTVYPGLSSVWQTIGTADFDGDGKTDVAWRNTSTGDVVFWFMNGTTITSAPTVYSALSMAWATVGTGDFNGDGKGDLLWRNTSTGDVYMWLMNGAQALSSGTVKAGLSTVYVTLGTGDLNGDGKTDILWQNTSTNDVSVWFQNGLTTSGVPPIIKKAFTGYQLLGVGDFNGDGRADLMWRNTSTSAIQTWWMNASLITSTQATMTSSNTALVSNGTFSDQF